MPYQKTCTVCNKEYLARVEISTTCSPECRKVFSKQYHKNRNNSNFETRSCEVCGTKFQPKRKASVTCSKSCKKKLEYRRLNPILVKECEYCDKMFQTRNKETIYCSQGCINSATRSHSPVKKKCEWCGETFEVPFVKRSRRFCSKSCSTQHTNNNRDEAAIREKISETKKEQYASGEVVHSWLGKSHSEDTKNKISETRIENGSAAGDRNPMYGKTGSSSPIFGIKRSRKTKELMSKVKAQNWLDGKYDGIDLNTSYKRGHYFSEKMQKNLYYRSSWEKTAFRWLDDQDEILFYNPEPFSIPYEYDHKRRYIPDILIAYKDGTQKLVEIKPEYLTSSKINQAKFKAAREYCAPRNILFEVWTEKHIAELVIEE